MAKRAITISTKLVSRAKICAATGLSPSGLKGILPQLTKGIHYIEIPGGRKFLYNEPLILDYLVNGRSEAHLRACDAFTRALPSSQAA